MEVPNSVLKYGFIALLVLLLAAVIAAVKKHQYDSELAQLRNDLAGSQKTVEITAGLYTKLSLETEDLRSLLDAKNQQVKDLLSQVKKNKEDLLAANQLAIRWKKAYEDFADAHQTDQGERKRVDFKKDFGMIGVSGFTLTDPAEAFVKVEQLRALAVTLVLSQDATSAWHSYATSDDPNTLIDISLSAVNPYVLQPRWYEKIELNATLAGGQSGSGFGVLAGIGVGYKIKQFTVGPAVFVGINDRLDKYFGINLAWRPFER